MNEEEEEEEMGGEREMNVNEGRIRMGNGALFISGGLDGFFRK